MLNLTDEQKALFKETGHFPGYIFTFSDLDLTITNETIHDQAVTVKESIMDESELTLGGCIASSIEFEVSEIMANQIVGHEFTAHIEVTDAENNVELDNLPMGTFIATSATGENNKDYKKVTAYDRLTLATVDVSDWYKGYFDPTTDDAGNTIETTHTVKETRESLLTYLGIPFVSQDLTNDDYVCEKTVEGGTLIGTDLLKMLCTINGGFGKMNRNGQFEIIYINALDAELDIAEVYSISAIAPNVKKIEYSNNPDDFPEKIQLPKIDGIDAFYNYSSTDNTLTYISEADKICQNSNYATSTPDDGIYAPFMYYRNMTDCDLSFLDLKGVTNVSGFFYNCNSLVNLELGGANLSDVKFFANVFNGSPIEVIDLSDLDLSSVINANTAFRNLPNLTKIYVNEQTFEHLAKDETPVFVNCPNLVGGNGTECGDGVKDASYARIDTPETPGLFTLKKNETKNNKVTIGDYRSLNPEEQSSGDISCVTVKGTSSEEVGITAGYNTSNQYIISNNIFFYNNSKKDSKNLCDYSSLTWEYKNGGQFYKDNTNSGVIVRTRENRSDSGAVLVDFSNSTKSDLSPILYPYAEKYTDGNYIFTVDVMLDGSGTDTRLIKIGFEGVDERTIPVDQSNYRHLVFPIKEKANFIIYNINEDGYRIKVSHLMILNKDEEDQKNFEKYHTPIKETIKNAAGNIFDKIKNIGYLPLTVNIDGLPYKETGDAFVIKKDSESDDLAENFIRSYILNRTLSGVASLLDQYEAKGTQERKNEVTATDEMYRTSGKQFVFSTSVDGLTAEMTNFETNVETQFGVYDGQVVMKVDANGNMALCELTGSPEEGTAFQVNADNIDLEAIDLNLTAKHMTITSNNFNVDSEGNVTANSLEMINGTITSPNFNVDSEGNVEASALTITGGNIDITTNTRRVNVLDLNGVAGLNEVTLYVDGMPRSFDYAGDGMPDNDFGETGEWYLDMQDGGLAYYKSPVGWQFAGKEVMSVSYATDTFLTRARLSSNDGMLLEEYNYMPYQENFYKNIFSANYLYDGIVLSMTTGTSKSGVTKEIPIKIEFDSWTDNVLYDDYYARIALGGRLFLKMLEIDSGTDEYGTDSYIRLRGEDGVLMVEDRNGSLSNIKSKNIAATNIEATDYYVGGKKQIFKSIDVDFSNKPGYAEFDTPNIATDMPFIVCLANGEDAFGTITKTAILPTKEKIAMYMNFGEFTGTLPFNVMYWENTT